MATLKFHKLTSTDANTQYTTGDIYFIKNSTGNTGKIYVCQSGGKGSAAVLEDYSVDTNTWRGIQNVLTSTSTTDSLSAAQGKALKDAADALTTRVTALETASGNHVTLNTAQTITAKKTFNADIAVGSCTLAYDATNKCLKFNFA